MIETGETTGDLPRNTIVFCGKPWKWPAAIMAICVALTFAWGAYLLGNYDDDDFFSDSRDLSVTEFLGRNAAMPDVQRLYYTVPPAVVGVGGAGVNAGPVGAGAIVGAAGYVVTTLHTVANLPEIVVQIATTAGVRRFPAQVVKSIPDHDLVLLKMQTRDSFLFFKLADGATIAPGQPVFAFGRNMQGASVVRQGMLVATDAPLTVNATVITHLLRSDAVYSWEQNGGPLVNANGELVGINLATTGPGGQVSGFAVPAHVLSAHFSDVLRFKVSLPQAAVAAPAGIVPAAASGFWAKAQTQQAGATGGFGLNVAQTRAAGAGIAPPQVTPFGIYDVDHTGGFRIAGYPLLDVVGLMVLALAAGVTGGMMTMGGGVLQVAGMMVFFGYGMYLIRPVAFLTNIFVYGASARRNNRAGLVQWDKVYPLIPWGVAGVVLGYFIGNAIGDGVVGVLLGGFALLMAGKALHEIAYGDVGPSETDGDTFGVASDDIDAFISESEDSGVKVQGKGRSWEVPPGHLRAALLGLPMGLISGILGISGGVVEVPLQRYLGKIGLQNAIANSSVLVFWASVAGSAVAFAHGVSSGLIHWEAPVFLAALMIPGAYFGGMIGTRLMHVLPVPALKGIYAATMTAIALKMLFGS
jgi:serine protease Do